MVPTSRVGRAAPLKGEGVAALDALCRPRTRAGRCYARFNPLTPADLALFRAAMAGEHAIAGPPQRGHHQTPLPTTGARPRRSPPTIRTGVSAHRKAARPRPCGQGATLPSVSSHPAPAAGRHQTPERTIFPTGRSAYGHAIGQARRRVSPLTVRSAGGPGGH
jgi:hypothetical protein